MKAGLRLESHVGSLEARGRACKYLILFATWPRLKQVPFVRAELRNQLEGLISAFASHSITQCIISPHWQR